MTPGSTANNGGAVDVGSDPRPAVIRGGRVVDLERILAEDGLTLERFFYLLLVSDVQDMKARVDQRRRASNEGPNSA